MKPTAWIKWLRGAECKPDGRCYDILFCDPNDESYEPLYSRTAPLSTDASACQDSGFLRSSLNQNNLSAPAEGLREALQPFAALVPAAFDHSYPDDLEITLVANGEPHAFLKNSDFRRAAAALNPSTGERS